MPRAWSVILLLFVLAAGIAPAQDLKGLLGGKAAPADPPEVPADLRSPRSTLSAFFEGMNSGELKRATATLDLSAFPAVVRNERGAQVAYRLWATLNRTKFVDLEQVPNRTEGAPYVVHTYRGPDNEVVGRFEVVRGDDGAWRISSATVESAEILWQQVRDRPLVDGLGDAARSALPLDELVRDTLPTSVRNRFWGLEQWQWGGLLLVFLLSWFAGVIVRVLAEWILRWRFRLVTEETTESLARAFWRAFSLVLALRFATLGLIFLGLPVGLSAALANVIFLSYALAWLWMLFTLYEIVLSVIARRAAVSERGQKLILPVARNLGRVALGAGVLVWFLAGIGVNVWGLVAGLGLGGAVLALAAKDSVENIFGSLTVLLESPYQIGDWVKIGDVEGVVEDITTRSTRIRTFEDSLLVMPNSKLVTANLENMGRRRHRRFRTMITLDATVSLAKLEAFLEKARAYLATREKLVQERTQIRLFDYTVNGLTVLLQTYLDVEDWTQEVEERETIMLELGRLAQAEGIAFGVGNPIMLRAAQV